ncbi:hypothetical protein chiPu_0004745 [Chiloscyllium punctatum]|uniref:Uncharacterized protein n=1 Tax=Chiloscyllium punctatum TaxID=137246 RepID=A0A401S7H0_CHIPU|nr:hypothetical protein [Chiloscyllium punctatum]
MRSTSAVGCDPLARMRLASGTGTVVPGARIRSSAGTARAGEGARLRSARARGRAGIILAGATHRVAFKSLRLSIDSEFNPSRETERPLITSVCCAPSPLLPKPSSLPAPLPLPFPPTPTPPSSHRHHFFFPPTDRPTDCQSGSHDVKVRGSREEERTESGREINQVSGRERRGGSSSAQRLREARGGGGGSASGAVMPTRG